MFEILYVYAYVCAWMDMGMSVVCYDSIYCVRVRLVGFLGGVTKQPLWRYAPDGFPHGVWFVGSVVSASFAFNVLMCESEGDCKLLLINGRCCWFFS